MSRRVGAEAIRHKAGCVRWQLTGRTPSHGGHRRMCRPVSQHFCAVGRRKSTPPRPRVRGGQLSCHRHPPPPRPGQGSAETVGIGSCHSGGSRCTAPPRSQRSGDGRLRSHGKRNSRRGMAAIPENQLDSFTTKNVTVVRTSCRPCNNTSLISATLHAVTNRT